MIKTEYNKCGVKTAVDHEEISMRNRKAQAYLNRKQEEYRKTRVTNVVLGCVYVALLYSIMIWFN